MGMRELRTLPDGHETRELFVTNYVWVQHWLSQALEGGAKAVGFFDKAIGTLIEDLGQPQPLQPLQPQQLPQAQLQLPDWTCLPQAERALHEVLVETAASDEQQEALFLGMRELRKLPDGHVSREQFVTDYGWVQHWLKLGQTGDSRAAACFSLAVDRLIEELPQPVAGSGGA